MSSVSDCANHNKNEKKKKTMYKPQSFKQTSSIQASIYIDNIQIVRLTDWLTNDWWCCLAKHVCEIGGNNYNYEHNKYKLTSFISRERERERKIIFFFFRKFDRILLKDEAEFYWHPILWQVTHMTRKRFWALEGDKKVSVNNDLSFLKRVKR